MSLEITGYDCGPALARLIFFGHLFARAPSLPVRRSDMIPLAKTTPRFLNFFGILHLGFGAMLACGATMEVVNMLLPHLLPAIQSNRFIQMHHTQPVLGIWTVTSNAINVIIGLCFIAAGLGLFRRQSWGPRLSRWCAKALLGIAAGGLVVCAVYLYPLAFEMMRSPEPASRKEGLVMLASMIGAAVFLPIYPGIVWWAFRGVEVGGTSAPDRAQADGSGLGLQPSHSVSP